VALCAPNLRIDFQYLLLRSDGFHFYNEETEAHFNDVGKMLGLLFLLVGVLLLLPFFSDEQIFIYNNITKTIKSKFIGSTEWMNESMNEWK